jgi:hypothetical protein
MKKMMSMLIKTYTKLSRYNNFEDRYNYLRIGGAIGAMTFGHSRYLNQSFYTSALWRALRNDVIIRDDGCDLGVPGYQIFDRIIVHHMNPVTEEDVVEHSDFLLNPDFLICTSRDTHNAIHFGDSSLLPELPIERFRNDTSPWLLKS